MNGRERFLRACRCEEVDRPPVWLMRQAGRYLPEYRDLRGKYSFLEACRNVDVIQEISLQPWRRFQMDAVIVFADILLPVATMGPKLTFEAGHGPQFSFPIRSLKDVENLATSSAKRTLEPTLTALEHLRSELKGGAALIGFVGAPWTIAAYMVEGGSGEFSRMLKLAEEEPKTVEMLIEKITDILVIAVKEQVRSGADLIQIFDSWGGLLSQDFYKRFSLPSITRLIDVIHDEGGLATHFVRDSEHLLPLMLTGNADVISIGPDTHLREALEFAKGKKAIQGNLNPEKLLLPPHLVCEETTEMLQAAQGFRGYIANLGPIGICEGEKSDSRKFES